MLAKFAYDPDEPLFFTRYWRGKGLLWKVFWIYGVLTSMVLGSVHFLTMVGGQESFQRVSLIVVLTYITWIAVSVWRCAPNAGRPIYGYTARGLTITWAINAVLMVVLLQLGACGDFLVLLEP